MSFFEDSMSRHQPEQPQPQQPQRQVRHGASQDAQPNLQQKQQHHEQQQMAFGMQMLSSTFQFRPTVDPSFQVNCRPNLLPRSCAKLAETARLRSELPIVEASDVGDARSDASTSASRPSFAWSSSDDGDVDDSGRRTTVMIRNLPEGFSRRMVENLLDAEGFAACYRFIYLPTDLATGTSFCYAFIDLATPEDAGRFRRHFTGFSRWRLASPKVAAVDWSEALQGVDQLVERYRNSPLMHPSVAETLRPALYRCGRRLTFPAPTVHLKAPRVRRASSRRVQRLAGVRPRAFTR
jgi:hypothetical protein